MNEQHFGEHDIVTLHNPTPNDFTFAVLGRTYVLPAGQSRQYLGYMAELGLKHLVDKILISQGKEKELLFEASRKIVEDTIIKDVQSINPEAPLEAPDAKMDAKYQELNDPGELPADPEEDDPTPFNLDSLPKDEELFPAPQKGVGTVEEAVDQGEQAPVIKPKKRARA